MHTSTTMGYTETHSTLPASWYRSEGMYELEKRAIFSKRWLCVSHSMRFKNKGEFVKFEIAGYSFFIIRDRKHELKAFLNICRHRAYPIMEAESGKASILSCKYHGEFKPQGEDIRSINSLLYSRMVLWSFWQSRKSSTVRYCCGL
jgi:phenylpropionate dioxygenase-like ring-hydroxylating dioxygenase large terminal subunit